MCIASVSSVYTDFLPGQILVMMTSVTVHQRFSHSLGVRVHKGSSEKRWSLFVFWDGFFQRFTYTSGSQTLVCIRIRWKSCKTMQITSPAHRVFVLVVLGRVLRLAFPIFTGGSLLWEPLIHSKKCKLKEFRCYPPLINICFSASTSFFKCPSFYLQRLQNWWTISLGPGKLQLIS